ncbi:MAG: nucleotidyltransferase family protein [Chloroflexi bacterium]|nr:nucleotidyltransferase family protein [Chloroflexota bacterium]
MGGEKTHTKTACLDAISQAILPILQHHGVRHAAVFGSLARGESTAASDLDLLVELPPGKTLLDLVAIELELEDLLGREVDVVTWVELHPRIRERVLKERVPIL